MIQQAYSIRKIASTLKTTKKFVELWKSRTNSKRNPCSERSKKITPIILQKIKRNLTRKNNGSFRKTAQKMQLSKTTIIRSRKYLHLKPYHIGKQHLFKYGHFQARINFAKKNKNTNWHQFLFCDETTITLR